jgi:hypothetical protein
VLFHWHVPSVAVCHLLLQVARVFEVASLLGSDDRAGNDAAVAIVDDDAALFTIVKALFPNTDSPTVTKSDPPTADDGNPTLLPSTASSIPRGMIDAVANHTAATTAHSGTPVAVLSSPIVDARSSGQAPPTTSSPPQMALLAVSEEDASETDANEAEANDANEVDDASDELSSGLQAMALTDTFVHESTCLCHPMLFPTASLVCKACPLPSSSTTTSPVTNKPSAILTSAPSPSSPPSVHRRSKGPLRKKVIDSSSSSSSSGSEDDRDDAGASCEGVTAPSANDSSSTIRIAVAAQPAESSSSSALRSSPVDDEVTAWQPRMREMEPASPTIADTLAQGMERLVISPPTATAAPLTVPVQTGRPNRPRPRVIVSSSESDSDGDNNGSDDDDGGGGGSGDGGGCTSNALTSDVVCISPIATTGGTADGGVSQEPPTTGRRRLQRRKGGQEEDDDESDGGEEAVDKGGAREPRERATTRRDRRGSDKATRAVETIVIDSDDSIGSLPRGWASSAENEDDDDDESFIV